MAATHPLDDPHDTGQVLYSSLLVLGLDAVSLEHSLRTPVNQKIFVRMNKKLGEEILHFLFTCIDQEKASKVFRDCWPLIDKKQEYQFHKATFEWYKSLQQEYGQPLPAVVAKTFLSPGGPKFTSALMTLSTIALHASLHKRVSEHTLIHFPTLSRNPNQNYSKLKLLQVSKRFYLQEFIAKQRTRQSFLSKLQERARSLVERYNALCSEDEMKKQELEQTLQKCERLSQQQKDSFMKSPLSEFQEEIMADISKLNGEAGDLWERVGTFHKIESSSWKVLAPLLDGTMSLSHVDGSLYTPTVPEIVYKDYAVDINKVGLQGLYTDGKLNLLSLVQYSTFALQSILKVVQATHSQARPESAQELKVLTGRASSMSESMSDLSNKLNTLLPSLIESVSTLRKCTSFTESFDNLDLEGKLQLCPPTPPLSLVNTPVNTPVSAHKSKKLLPLHLTPVLGLLGNKRRTVHCMNGITPTRLLSSINITRAAKRSPKADVSFSSSTHLDDSVIIDARKDAKKLEEEAGLTLEMVTVDCRGNYKLKQDQKNLYKLEQTNHQPKGNRGVRSAASRPSQIPKYGIKASNMVSKESVMQRGDKSVGEVCKKVSCNEPDTTCSPSIKETSTTISESRLAEELLTEQIADMLANDEYDDSGTAELLTTLSSGNNTVIEASTGDSGCVEETIDSETLLDAIEKIDITPKSKHKKNRARSSLHRSVGSVKSHALANSSVLSPLAREDKQSPVKPDYTPKTDTQCTRLIDYTPCIRNGGHLSVAVGLSCEDPFKTPMPLQQLGGHKVASYSSQKSERGFSVLSSTESKSPTNDDLIARMALLTQSPARDNPTPLASKILSKFEDVNFGKGKNTLKSVADDGYSSTVEELRHQSKSSLNNLMKQVQQVKEEYPAKVEKMKQRRKTECGFNSKFLTLVKNIKNGKDSIQTTELKESYNSGGQNCESTDEGHKPELLVNSRDSFHSTVARLEALLDDDDDDDDTFTGNLGKITLSTEDTEKFMDCEEFEKTLLQTPGQQSSYLPRNSIFDTLTESILAGEVCSSLLTKEDVQDEIRRESISSRRQSLISLGRMSIGSNKGLSEALSVFQHRMSTGCAGILDESDSCLLSISVDDFEDF